VYDSLGRTLTVTDPLGTTVAYTYDTLGRVITTTSTVDGGTSLTKTYYDAVGNVTKTLVKNGASSFSRTENAYDSMNRLLSVSAYDGASAAMTTSYTYDARGNVLTQTTGGAPVTYAYDRFGNNTSITDALSQTETYTYDISGALTSSTDRNGVVTTYTYLAPGIISSKTASHNGSLLSVSFTYTATGAVRSQTSDGVTLTYTYDNRGNVLSETETDGAQTIKNEYTYDARNLRISYNTYRNGAQISNQYYTYNALGQLVESGDHNDPWDETLTREVDTVTYEVGPSADDANTVYFLDELVGSYTTVSQYTYGDKLKIDNTYYAFDIMDYTGDPVAVSGEIYIANGGSGGTIYWGDRTVPTTITTIEPVNYDPYYILDSNGEVWLTLLFHPMMYYCEIYVGNMGYEYTHVNEIHTITEETYTVHHTTGAQHTTVAYTYDARGNVLTETKDNNTSTVYTYTAEGLVKTKTNYTGNAVTSSFTYTYYPNGNVATETTNTGKVTTYLYDDLGRIVSEAVTGTSNNGTITYTYDNRGNRLTQTRDGITVSYTYDLNNRLTTSTANGVTGYTYDANGNTLSVMGTSGSATYTYDLFNRQKTHTSGGVVTTTTYRPDGLRHSIGGTKHIWDGQNIVGEYVGTTYRKYFRALNLVYRLASNTKQWYNTNGHGDVIALTNATGTVVKTYTYNAFGEEQDISNTDGNPFRYCGEYYDTACGKLYLRARNYDATTGRFTQQDGWEYGDISNPLSLNLYIYGLNSPINGIDPSGHLFGLILAGALINVATSLLASVITGQEYTLVDGLIDAFTGGLCALSGMAPKVISGLISGGYRTYKAIQDGSTIGEAFLCGGVSFITTTYCVSNFDMFKGVEKFSTSASIAACASFGFGGNLVSSATSNSMISMSQMEKNETSQTNIEVNGNDKNKIEINTNNIRHKNGSNIKNMRKRLIGELIGDELIKDMTTIKENVEKLNQIKKIKNLRKQRVSDKINNWTIENSY